VLSGNAFFAAPHASGCALFFQLMNDFLHIKSSLVFFSALSFRAGC
jgi:hypothetical protein